MTSYFLKCQQKNVARRILLIVLLIICLIFIKMFVVNNVSLNCYPDYLIRLMKGPISYDDPELIRYIRENVLEPPSSFPYNLDVTSRSRYYESEKFYSEHNEKLFKSKRHGFFVEAGALDGQAMSNTLELERKLGWTGLLVEPDPSNYIALKKRNRKAWTAKACLSITGYPKEEKLTSFNIIKSPGSGRSGMRAMGSIVNQHRNHTFSYRGNMIEEVVNSFYERQCFPLESLLLALNVTRVDLLSLDVEMFEKEIIENFNFDQFHIEVIYMEWWNLKKLQWLNEFMESKGFYYVKNILADIIYVKKNSTSQRIVDDKGLRGIFTLFENVIIAN